MQNYINQLLEDMEHAHREEDAIEESNSSNPFDDEDDFAYLERWINHKPVQTFGFYCGLEKEQFPPAEMLTKKQQYQLSNGFMQLLRSWNLGVQLPKKFPIAKKYTLLCGLLNVKTDIVSDGNIDFEFCTFDPPSCPFKEYCVCDEWEVGTTVEEEKDANTPNKDVPF
ncbi:MAG: hypothetical protein ABI763_07475 [Bacteroidota bacterium]